MHHCLTCDKYMKKSSWKAHQKSRKHIELGAGLGDWIRSKLVRDGFNNKSQKTISEFGEWKIMKMNIYRKPIASALEKVLNLISLGTFTKAKEEDYDKLFHLGLFCVLNDNAGRFVNVLCEKNATIEITRTTFDIKQFGETQPIHIRNALSLNALLEGGQKMLGSNFFIYDPFESNCQMFVRALLQGSNLYSEQANKFVFQSVENIVKTIPSYVPKVARTITDLAGIADNLFGGNLVLHAIKLKKDAYSKQEATKEAEHIAKRKGMKYKDYKDYHSYRVVPKTKIIPKSYRSKKVRNGNILLVFGELI